MTLDAIIEAVGREPYFRDESVCIYNADCRDILPLIPAGGVGLVLTDPPYGINYVSGLGQRLVGDDEPFNPHPLLQYGRCVIWGADNFAHLLPPSRGWLVW